MFARRGLCRLSPLVARTSRLLTSSSGGISHPAVVLGTTADVVFVRPAPSHPWSTHSRGFASTIATLSEEEKRKLLDTINDAFAEARDEMESAMESVGTTYFNDEANFAKTCVEKTLGLYAELLAGMEEKERASTQRSMGMKMEQLKAEVQLLDTAHDD